MKEKLYIGDNIINSVISDTVELGFLFNCGWDTIDARIYAAKEYAECTFDSIVVDFTSSRIFVCPECEAEFIPEDQLRTHMNVFHIMPPLIFGANVFRNTKELPSSNATLIGFSVDTYSKAIGEKTQPLTLSMEFELDDGRRVSVSGQSATRYMNKTKIGARFDILISEVVSNDET